MSTQTCGLYDALPPGDQGLLDIVIVSYLVSSVKFNCIVQYSLYHDMDIDNKRVTLCIGQQHPITVYRTVF